VLVLLGCGFVYALFDLGFRVGKVRRQYETRMWLESVGGFAVYGDLTPRGWMKWTKGEPVLDTIQVVGITSGSPPLDRVKLEMLPSLKKLRVVAFEITDLIDDDLKVIARCEDLHGLSVADSSITDRGLEHLKGMPNLRRLKLTGCDVSDEAVAALAETLPRLEEIAR